MIRSSRANRRRTAYGLIPYISTTKNKTMKKYLGAYLVIVAAYLIYLVLRIYNGGAFDWFGDLSIPFFLLLLYWSIQSNEKKNQK